MQNISQASGCGAWQYFTMFTMFTIAARYNNIVSLAAQRPMWPLWVSYATLASYHPMCPFNLRWNFKFDTRETQSLMVYNQRVMTKEMMHGMHYYRVSHVQAFQEQVDRVTKRSCEEPVSLKFLCNTPRSRRKIINMLMPTAAEPVQATVDEPADTTTDVVLETCAPDPQMNPSFKQRRRKRLRWMNQEMVKRLNKLVKLIWLKLWSAARLQNITLKPRARHSTRPAPKETTRDPRELARGKAIAPKARPSQAASSSSAKSNNPTHTPDAVSSTPMQTTAPNTTTIDLTSSVPGDDNARADDTGSRHDVRDHPRSPRSAWNRRNESQWRPKLGKGATPEPSSSRKGGKCSVRWAPTSIYYDDDQARADLWVQYPNIMDS